MLPARFEAGAGAIAAFFESPLFDAATLDESAPPLAPPLPPPEPMPAPEPEPDAGLLLPRFMRLAGVIGVMPFGVRLGMGGGGMMWLRSTGEGVEDVVDAGPFWCRCCCTPRWSIAAGGRCVIVWPAENFGVTSGEFGKEKVCGWVPPELGCRPRWVGLSIGDGLDLAGRALRCGPVPAELPDPDPTEALTRGDKPAEPC